MNARSHVIAPMPDKLTVGQKAARRQPCACSEGRLLRLFIDAQRVERDWCALLAGAEADGRAEHIPAGPPGSGTAAKTRIRLGGGDDPASPLVLPRRPPAPMLRLPCSPRRLRTGARPRGRRERRSSRSSRGSPSDESEPPGELAGRRPSGGAA